MANSFRLVYIRENWYTWHYWVRTSLTLKFDVLDNVESLGTPIDLDRDRSICL
jgi:hypothetical protein